jgi:hypothetical protein
MTWNARHTALVEEENTCDCTAVARFPPWLSIRPSPLIVKAASNFSVILQRAVAVLQVIDLESGKLGEPTRCVYARFCNKIMVKIMTIRCRREVTHLSVCFRVQLGIRFLIVSPPPGV